MPSQKKKPKKVKPVIKVEPTTVKEEPQELKPLADYIDDRLELIRQVFACVKPKEIKYLLPEFLQGKSSETIKERCLDELLGVSTKRLRSIINNTKCPTDTESSSENSDVEKIEEHISLDEISSESEEELNRLVRQAKDRKTKGAKDATGQNSKPGENRNGNAKNAGEKEMTVLELLELQARARAIRSQLALEPITKIELDSEHEADIDTDDEQGKSKPAAATSLPVGDDSTNANQQQTTQQQPVVAQQTKRIRLKRNFRIRQVGDEDDEDENRDTQKVQEPKLEQPVTEPIPEPVPANEPQPEPKVSESKVPEKSADEGEKNMQADDTGKAVEQSAAEQDVVVQPVNNDEAATQNGSEVVVLETETLVDEKGRESSPEVVPVLASPETLCISSDSEEERLAKERASIFVDNVEELDRLAKEQQAEKENPKPPVSSADDETEEGEISEDEPSKSEEVEPQQEPKETPIEVDDAIVTITDGTADSVKSLTRPVGVGIEKEELDYDEEEKEDDRQMEGGSKADPTVEPEAIADPSEGHIEVHCLSSDSDDSSASGSDSSQEENAADDQEKLDAEKKTNDDPCQDDADIVEIHDSGDEKLLLTVDKPVDEPDKSWNTRWLRSNRVAKVMATSRLGNKVREKLKKKKQTQQIEQQQQQLAEEEDECKKQAAEALSKVDSTPELPPNVEVGSVEHYRELIAAATGSSQQLDNQAEENKSSTI